MKLMKPLATFAMFAAFAVAAIAQTANPATITVSTIVTAAAGSPGANQITCTFQNVAGTPTVNCPNLPAGLTLAVPAMGAPGGAISGIVGSTSIGNAVSWIFTGSGTVGKWNYSITANSQVSTGTF